EEFVSPGSGVLCDLLPGMNLTLMDYARLMMMLSDNTATDYLYSLTGRDNIKNNVIDPFGLTKTKCDYPCKLLIETYFDPAHKVEEGERNWRNTDDYRCLTPTNDSTSCNDMAKVLKMAYDKTLFSPWVSEQMIDIMKRCHTNSRIPKELPRDVEVAHKTGTMDKVANDCGIVYTAKGDYILCLFYNGNVATQEEYDANKKGRFSDGLLAEISKEIYAAYME
ncbi:MAG: serine hydrolase, partial [Clostridia bacterium]|nr:serine hydrolase [Clostridia bacterium]